MPYRQFAQFRGRYILQMLDMIVETMDVLMPTDGSVDELAERQLARVLKKIGNLTEVPAPLIAMELHKRRGTDK